MTKNLIKKISKSIGIIIGLIFSLSQIFDVYMKYKSDFKGIITHIKQFDFHLISQLIVILGFAFILTILVVFCVKWIFRIKRPERDGLDYIAEILLPEDKLENSEPKHRKRLKKYKLLNAGLYLIFFGVFIMIGVRIFNKTNTTSIDKSNFKGYLIDSTLISKFDRAKRLNPHNSNFEFYKIASFDYDLNNNQIKDTIILKRLKGWENDPGDFQQIQIIMDNDSIWTETNFDGWVGCVLITIISFLTPLKD